jgi:hypothetical protein
MPRKINGQYAVRYSKRGLGQRPAVDAAAEPMNQQDGTALSLNQTVDLPRPGRD